jgi:hypothetical protein
MPLLSDRRGHARVVLMPIIDAENSVDKAALNVESDCDLCAKR